jgi:hypothetical protein
MVELLIGPEEQSISAHRKMLSETSVYFEKMFSANWQNEASTIKFAEDDPESFDIMIKWFYRKNLREVVLFVASIPTDYFQAVLSTIRIQTP